jgi:pyrimidine-nucleoside phosphorylase
MSKKIAAGADSILLDVKVGSGAFMKTLEEARELAQVMVDIGRDCGRSMAAVLTCMDAPLGQAVGNGLEVAEAVDVLKGGGPEDIKELSIELTAGILAMAKDIPLEKAREMASATLKDGRAFNKFVEMVSAQGGDISYIQNPAMFMSATVTPLTSPVSGYVCAMNGELCGTASHILGHCPMGLHDPAAGIIFHKKIGDRVEKGETLADLHSDIPEAIQESLQMLTAAYTFSDTKPKIGPLVLETM